MESAAHVRPRTTREQVIPSHPLDDSPLSAVVCRVWFLATLLGAHCAACADRPLVLRSVLRPPARMRARRQSWLPWDAAKLLGRASARSGARGKQCRSPPSATCRFSPLRHTFQFFRCARRHPSCLFWKFSARSSPCAWAHAVTGPVDATRPFSPTAHQFCGQEGTGKTSLLLHLIAHCVLPTQLQGITLPGRGSSVYLVDVDGRFPLQRLAAVLAAIIREHGGGSPVSSLLCAVATRAVFEPIRVPRPVAAAQGTQRVQGKQPTSLETTLLTHASKSRCSMCLSHPAADTAGLRWKCLRHSRPHGQSLMSTLASASCVW